ncbi:hypothetical protein DFP73DRAFT_622287 [Morchella snyderi]|nr:hypothetical protein DFP73DRAFT_622287 [Morchella snyderi]
MASMSSKRISNGAVIDCSHPSKRSACQNIHRETDAANGIALPFIMFRELPAKRAEAVVDPASIVASASSSPPSEPAKVVPSPEALEFLSALFFRSYVAPRFKVPFGVYHPVDAPCSTYIGPEEQLSLLAHKLQGFDITAVQINWTAIQAESPTPTVTSSKKKPDSFDKLSAQLTKNSLETLRKDLAKPNEALTTRVTKRVFSKRSRPLVHPSPLSISPLTPINDSTTSSHGSDASTVFSDSDNEDSHSGTYCSSEKQLDQNSSIVDESVGVSSTACKSVGDARCGNEVVETQVSLIESQCGNLTCGDTSTWGPSICGAQPGQDILNMNDTPARNNNSISSNLGLNEVVQCNPIDRDMREEQMISPDLRNNDMNETIKNTLLQQGDLPDTDIPQSVILLEAESSMLANSQDDTILDEQHLILSLPDTALDSVQESRVAGFSPPQACDASHNEFYSAGPILTPTNYNSCTEIAFAQSTPIFDSGEPSTPICKLFPDSIPARCELPLLEVDAVSEYEGSDECVCEKARDSNDHPSPCSPVTMGRQEPVAVAVKVIATSLDGDVIKDTSLNTTSPVGDIDAEFEARGWALGGSWQDDDDLEDPVPSRLQIVKQGVHPAYEESRFENICKNLNMTCVSDGFYRWNPGN